MQKPCWYWQTKAWSIKQKYINWKKQQDIKGKHKRNVLFVAISVMFENDDTIVVDPKQIFVQELIWKCVLEKYYLCVTQIENTISMFTSSYVREYEQPEDHTKIKRHFCWAWKWLLFICKFYAKLKNTMEFIYHW